MRATRRDSSVARHSGRGAFRTLAALLVLVLALAAAACTGGHEPAPTDNANSIKPSGPPVPATAPPAAGAATPRDLSEDEAAGGHTLSRHTGRTDAQLAERLRRERQISAASTYSDRATAERVVGAALAAAHDRIDRWLERSGSRPNLTVDYRADAQIGRVLRRGRSRSEPSDRALVVLKWDDRRHRSFVLTSYPEEAR